MGAYLELVEPGMYSIVVQFRFRMLHPHGLVNAPSTWRKGTCTFTHSEFCYGFHQLLNEKTGHSQLMGGVVWGVGMALMEATEYDLRYGRPVNANLAEYHVPVNADIGVIDIVVVPEKDAHINPLGAKGIGEIGITGVAAAIANAVYHATGKRVRDLPITLDKVR